MLAQWFGNPPDPLPWNPGPGWACEYPTLWYPCTAASRYWMVAARSTWWRSRTVRSECRPRRVASSTPRLRATRSAVSCEAASVAWSSRRMACCLTARLERTGFRLSIRDRMVRSLLASVVDTTFSAVIRLASWARRWSTAWVTLARPLTSRLTCWAFPAVIWLTSRSRLLRAAASDLRSSRTETSLSEVMLTGVEVMDRGITSPSASWALAVPFWSSTVSRPSRVWITTLALVSRVSLTPELTARSMATRPRCTVSPLTVPALSPATVTSSPGLMPAASEKYAVTL